ncbi:unnamed protein product, partial [marine sediment metagenome]
LNRRNLYIKLHQILSHLDVIENLSVPTYLLGKSIDGVKKLYRTGRF